MSVRPLLLKSETELTAEKADEKEFLLIKI